ncbi:MAG: diguanylate cyclase, partial [bacterium]|nr:diguanylate cyclase [bacterium]
YETGAVDYLFKPLDPMILKSKVNIFLELHRSKQELKKNKQKIEIQNEKLKELSVRDGLTGLYNHRHFHELLNREFLLARRNSTDLACFMMDLDYFKDINDTFGHTFGDFVLKNFSQLILGVIRKTDILARYGGEEFALLLPNTDLEGAWVLAEKFRKKAGKFDYKYDGYSKRVTTSIGIATLRAHYPGESGRLVSFADKALYRAKAEGRNRVNIYNREALTQAGEVILPDQGYDQLPGLPAHLTKILEKTRESILVSLDSLTQIPLPAQENQQQYNREHNHRTMEILDLMAERLGLPRPVLKSFKRAARLHDLFKIYLKDGTPLKDGPLDKEEQLNVRDYPFMLEHLTRTFDVFADEREILRYHHENYDGSGYPEGLQGREVPLGSRLFALVDAFVSMTSQRNYRPMLAPGEVVDELVKQAGHQFDPLLVKHLLGLIRDKKLMKVPKKQLQSAEKALGK